MLRRTLVNDVNPARRYGFVRKQLLHVAAVMRVPLAGQELGLANL